VSVLELDEPTTQGFIEILFRYLFGGIGCSNASIVD